MQHLSLSLFSFTLNILVSHIEISSFPLLPFFQQRTIVSILVDVPQRCYRRAKTSEGVCAVKGDRTGESERGCLQVQVHPAHFSGLALHFSLHVQGGSDQHIVSPADTSRS